MPPLVPTMWTVYVPVGVPGITGGGELLFPPPPPHAVIPAKATQSVSVPRYITRLRRFDRLTNRGTNSSNPGRTIAHPRVVGFLVLAKFPAAGAALDCAVVLMVMMTVPPAVMDAGENVQLVLLGSPLHAKVKLFANAAPAGVISMLKL